MMGLVWAGIEAPPSDGVPPTRCELEIRGLPRSAVDSHVLHYNDRFRPLRGLRVTLELGRQSLRIRLRGPRYRADHVVTREQCGTQAIVLHAQPLPAKLVFECPPPGLVVRCLNCLAPVGSRPHVPDAFPKLPVDEAPRLLQLELKAAGFRRRLVRVQLLPGDNIIRAKLSPLS